MSERFTRWDVAESLQTEEDMRLYLEACAEEDPGDGSLIRAARDDVARARGAVRPAGKEEMIREGLSIRMLEEMELGYD